MDSAHPFETKNDLYHSDRGLPFNVATGCHAKCMGLPCKKLPAHSFRCSVARHCLLFFKDNGEQQNNGKNEQEVFYREGPGI